MTRFEAVLDPQRAGLLDRLAGRIDHADGVPGDVRRALRLLVVDADPRRAEALDLAADDPPVVAERLAAWALQRSSDAAVVRASRALDGSAPTEPRRDRRPVAESPVLDRVLRADPARRGAEAVAAGS